MKKYFAATNFYGFNLSADSQGWSVYAFADQASRDEWVGENSHNRDHTHVADKVTRVEALRIARAQSTRFFGRIVIDPAMGDGNALGGLTREYSTVSAQPKLISI